MTSVFTEQNQYKSHKYEIILHWILAKRLKEASTRSKGVDNTYLTSSWD